MAKLSYGKVVGETWKTYLELEIWSEEGKRGAVFGVDNREEDGVEEKVAQLGSILAELTGNKVNITLSQAVNYAFMPKEREG